MISLGDVENESSYLQWRSSIAYHYLRSMGLRPTTERGMLGTLKALGINYNGKRTHVPRPSKASTGNPEDSKKPKIHITTLRERLHRREKEELTMSKGPNDVTMKVSVPSQSLWLVLKGLEAKGLHPYNRQSTIRLLVDWAAREFASTFSLEPPTLPEARKALVDSFKVDKALNIQGWGTKSAEDSSLESSIASATAKALEAFGSQDRSNSEQSNNNKQGESSNEQENLPK